MPTIAKVQVQIDDNVPENGQGLLHCKSVVSLDDQLHEVARYRHLLESAEFRTEGELIREVAKRVGVKPSVIELIH